MSESRNDRRRGTFLVLLGGVLFGAVAVSGLEPETNDAGSVPAPVHDGDLLERSIELSRALLSEDAAAAYEAARRLHAGCRVLMPEDLDHYGSAIRSIDKTFHAALLQTRELIAQGQVEEALGQQAWVERSCLICHRLAREQALPGVPGGGE